MENVFNDTEKLRNLDWLGSVWRITTVNPAISSFELGIKEPHPAPFPEELAYRLISLFSKRRDMVLDPFCGSGTTNVIALGLGRETIGYDIEQKFIDIAGNRCKGKGKFFCKSSEEMKELQNESVDLCITSPPYLRAVKYSDNPLNIGNLPESYSLLIKTFKEVYRVLQKNGIFCLNVASVAEKGFLNTFPFDLLYKCLEIGFKLRSSVIWDKGLLIKEWNLQHSEIAENHEYIWVLKK
jgi:site-specific DNA-methyltransferase (adenine-specific)